LKFGENSFWTRHNLFPEALSERFKVFTLVDMLK